MNPFNKFDRIYLINLKRCPERLIQFAKEAQEYGIDFEIFEAVEHEIGSYGCSLSHIEIIKKAKAEGLKNVLIFEDDCIFLYPKKYVWEAVKKFFTTDCDVFYLGSNLVWDENKKYSKCLGRFSVAYNSSAYDYLIDNFPTLEEFKADRLKRGDVFLAHSPLKKSGCKIPLTSVKSTKSFTGSFAKKTLNNPWECGQDHFTLITSGYFQQGLIDFENIKPEMKKLFISSIPKTSKRYKEKIKEMTANLNPFNFIDEIRCINLKEDVDRWEVVSEIFEQYGVNCKRFDAIRKKSGWAGSTLSHRKCIEEAKQSGAENVLIFEDDFFFIHEPEKVRQMLFSVFQKDFDILYLGLTLRDTAENVSRDLYKVSKGWGAYAYVVNSRIYDKLLELLPEDENGISQELRTVSDVIYYDKIQPLGNCFIIPVASSRDNFSHNWNKERSETVKTILNKYEKHLQKNPEQKKTYNVDYKKYPEVIKKHSESSGHIKSYVINLERSQERMLIFSDRQSKTELVSEIVRPVELDDPRIIKNMELRKLPKPEKKLIEFSNQLTFADILRKEKEKNIIVFEDDVIFSNDFDKTLNKILSELPDDFGVCYLGAYIKRKFALKKYSENLIEFIEPTHKIWGAHAVIFNRKYYKLLAKNLSDPFSLQTDFEIARTLTDKARCFFAYPMIAMQDPDLLSSMGHTLKFRKMEAENPKYIEENLR